MLKTGKLKVRGKGIGQPSVNSIGRGDGDLDGGRIGRAGDLDGGSIGRGGEILGGGNSNSGGIGRGLGSGKLRVRGRGGGQPSVNSIGRGDVELDGGGKRGVALDGGDLDDGNIERGGRHLRGGMLGRGVRYLSGGKIGRGGGHLSGGNIEGGGGHFSGKNIGNGGGHLSGSSIGKGGGYLSGGDSNVGDNNLLRGNMVRTTTPAENYAEDDDIEHDDVSDHYDMDSPHIHQHSQSHGSGVGSSLLTNELVPGGFWFHKPEVVRKVSDVIRSNFSALYMSWSDTPVAVKQHWFNSFKNSFKWNLEYEDQVKEAFNANAQLRLKDMINKAGKSKKCPSWMGEVIYNRLKAKRQDPTFKKRSEKALKNKRSGLRDDMPVDPGHRVGSISTLEVVERLTRENEGVIPPASETFMMAHSMPTADGERKIVSCKAKQILETYENKLQEYDQQGIDKTEDEIFYEVVGGRQHGVVYGLGSSADLYYKKSSSRSLSSKSTASYAPSLISQLEDRVQKAEEEAELAKAEAMIAREQVGIVKEQAEKANEQAEIAEKSVEENRSQVAQILKKLDEFIYATIQAPNQMHSNSNP